MLVVQPHMCPLHHTVTGKHKSLRVTHYTIHPIDFQDRKRRAINALTLATHLRFCSEHVGVRRPTQYVGRRRLGEVAIRARQEMPRGLGASAEALTACRRDGGGPSPNSSQTVAELATIRDVDWTCSPRRAVPRDLGEISGKSWRLRLRTHCHLTSPVCEKSGARRLGEADRPRKPVVALLVVETRSFWNSMCDYEYDNEDE